MALTKEEITIRRKKYKETNKEKLREESIQYRIINAEKIKERNKKYREKIKILCPEITKAVQAEYFKKHGKKLYEKNKEKIRPKRKQRSKEEISRLSDRYIVKLLCKSNPLIDKKIITKELIELKRITLKIERLCRQQVQ